MPKKQIVESKPQRKTHASQASFLDEKYAFKATETLGREGLYDYEAIVGSTPRRKLMPCRQVFWMKSMPFRQLRPWAEKGSYAYKAIVESMPQRKLAPCELERQSQQATQRGVHGASAR